ncbi:MAG: GNAT family N-acetyltransferase [Solirubrobacterales bacterium]
MAPLRARATATAGSAAEAPSELTSPAEEAEARETGAIEYRIADGPIEVRDAQDLRVKVFCREQGVPREAEIDGLDADSIHIVGVQDGIVVGTCRLQYEPSGFRLGRMAVEQERRRDGIGSGLLEAAELAAARWGAREIVLHSQTQSELFFAASGYVAEGGTFEEDGIEHVLMRKQISEPGS